MLNRLAEPETRYGGPWTLKKLDILETYLDHYTTALKNRSFKLMYIDAFAGTGYVGPFREDFDATEFTRGSAARAAHIRDRQFDRLVFVENDPGRCEELATLREEQPRRDIRIENADANEYLSKLHQDWNQWRGVLFLDPFATQVAWSTIERIARFNALDTWILFPSSAIARMLPTSKRPDDIAPGWNDRLTTVFGDESWRGLYRESPQWSLFGDVEHERAPGVDGLLEIYKNKLTEVFGRRFLSRSRTLRNTKNAPLFEFLFCVGSPSPRAIGAAHRIAGHILENL